MMTTRLRFLASSSGSAAMPSRSGISMSSTATSGLARSTWLTASSPVRSEAATVMSGSASIQRPIRPRITTESSTTMTRKGSCRAESPSRELASATLITHQTQSNTTGTAARREPAGRRAGRRSDQTDFMKFRRDDVLVERLHDVFVGAGVQRARDVGDVVLGGAEHHLGRIAAGHAAQVAQEFIAVHDRHVPVEQDGVGQPALADFQRLLAVLGLGDLEIQPFQYTPRDFSDHARVVDHQTCLHFSLCSLFEFQTSVSIIDQIAPLASHAASMSGRISSTRSTSSTTINCP